MSIDVFEDNEKEYKLVAPDVDELLRYFDDHNYYPEEAAVKLCELIVPAVHESIRLLQENKYNDFVEKYLPYQFRVGVVKRNNI